MSLTTIIGIAIVFFIALLCVFLYLIINSILRTKKAQKVEIIIEDKKEEQKQRKVSNTPYRVDTDVDSRLSTDLIDETVVSNIKKSVEIKENGSEKKGNQKKGSNKKSSKKVSRKKVAKKSSKKSS